MDTILHQFDSNEAILLMYLANELPADSRAEVEAVLKKDPALRQQFEAIRSAYSYFDNALTVADGSSKMPSSFSAARQFGQAIRDKNKSRPSRDEPGMMNWRRMNWLLYPIAAAAMLAIGMYAWYQVAVDAEDFRPALVRRAFYGGQYRGIWLDLNRTGVIDVQNDPDEKIEAAFDLVVIDNPLPSQRELDSITDLNDRFEDQLQ